jgi:AAHS family 4-hydroxybenzoate transporter-like MFS transporter
LNKATINVVSVIDSARVSPIQWRVFVLGMIISLLDGYDTLALTYALNSMAGQWHVKPVAFAPAFTAALLGTCVGGLTFGQLGDKLGRRKMLLIASLLFGLTTLATPFATNTMHLMVLRFLVGVGVGGLLPNVTTIVADYAPERHRKSAVMIIVGCLAGGAFFGGLIAKQLLPLYGWQSIFYVGGGASLLMSIVLLIALPESPAFLALSDLPDRARRVAAILRKIAPSMAIADGVTFVVNRHAVKRASLRVLFSDGRAPVTLLIWLALSIDLIVSYLFTFWMPTLARENGASAGVALTASALYSLGGMLSSVILGPISARIGQHLALIICFLLIIVASVLLSNAGVQTGVLYGGAVLTGISAFGAWPAITALTTTYYPIEVRATAIGYSTGVGRIAAMLSPVVVGILLAEGFRAKQILLTPILPALVAVGCVVAIAMLRRGEGVGVTA